MLYDRKGDEKKSRILNNKHKKKNFSYHHDDLHIYHLIVWMTSMKYFIVMQEKRVKKDFCRRHDNKTNKTKNAIYTRIFKHFGSN